MTVQPSFSNAENTAMAVLLMLGLLSGLLLIDSVYTCQAYML